MSTRPTVPTDASFTSRLRSAAVAARVGTVLGICFGVCFLTGLVSHYAQNASQPVPFPTSPAWGYRVTQGLHVATGIASIPLLLVKLWTVFPLLLKAVPAGWGERAKEAGERVSIAALVASSIFLLVTGLLNSTQWYPWDFSFRRTHYALAWVAIGALLLHVAVKLPTTTTALRHDVNDTSLDRPTATRPGALGRRGLLRATWAASALAVVATAGSTVPWLRRVSVLGVRSGEGPGGVPINRTAAAAGVTADAVGASYRLLVVHGDRSVSLSREDLLAMTQRTEELPIACVEGWSASASWTGVRLRDLLDLVEAPRGADVAVTSLQVRGAFARTLLQDGFADDDRTLVALALSGEELDLDHGYPARLIAPNRPGVLQTKWLSRLEVLA